MTSSMAIGIFCGSSTGRRSLYSSSAKRVGEALAQRNVGIVYGGGRVGLMGILADAALAAGGTVTGVIPRSLFNSEIAHDGLTDLIVVETMHARKAKMAELSDCFIALPGGAGTLEELFEQWTWVQLGIHAKPCGILNADGYFDPLLKMRDRMVREGFLKSEYAAMLVSGTDIEEILERFGKLERPVPKWTSAQA